MTSTWLRRDDSPHRGVVAGATLGAETVLPEREAWLAEDDGAAVGVLVLDGDNEERAPDVRYVRGAHPEGGYDLHG